MHQGGGPNTGDRKKKVLSSETARGGEACCEKEKDQESGWLEDSCTRQQEIQSWRAEKEGEDSHTIISENVSQECNLCLISQIIGLEGLATLILATVMNPDTDGKGNALLLLQPRG